MGNPAENKAKGRGVEGNVLVADDVVAMIASLAAGEVEGVEPLGGPITNGVMSKTSSRKLTRGTRVKVSEGRAKVQLALTMGYGVNIPKSCALVQEKVKTAIETMTGLQCGEVGIRIVGVNMKKGR